MYISMFPHNIDAKSSNETGLVTFLYEANTEEEYATVRLIEANLSGLFDEVMMQSFEEVNDRPIESDLVVGYVGTVGTSENLVLQQKLVNYDGPVIALGQFFKVAPQFPKWESQGYIPVHTIATMTLPELYMLPHVKNDTKSQVLQYAEGYNEEVPLIVQHNEHRALFLEHYTQLEAQILMNNLFDLYSKKYEGFSHPSYIIVEDINPLTNIEKLAEVANEFTARNIPLILNVSSIYINNESSLSTTLADSEPLVQLLVELQGQGAIIIVNDYIDYGSNEKQGEAIAVNTEQVLADLDSLPGQTTSQMYGQSNEGLTSSLKKSDFSTAIQILVQEEIFPAGFYSKNERLLQVNYLEIANKTATFFGKLSLSDDPSIEKKSPLFISKPLLLNRQKLFPVTLSAPQYNYDDPLLLMKNDIDRIMQVDKAVLSTTFSMYDELPILSAMLSTFGNVPDMYWYDFQQEPFHIQTDKFQVENVEGVYKVISSWTTIDELKWRFRDRPLEIILWVLVFLPIAFVVLFIINIFFLRLRYRKNLFEERT